MEFIRGWQKVKPERWARYKYNLTTSLKGNGERYTGCPEHIALSKAAASEGMVLLKNDGTLPLKEGSKLAVFGVGSIDYKSSGWGSGRVSSAYIKNIYDGLNEKNRFRIFDELSKWYYDYCCNLVASGDTSKFYPEPMVPDELLEKSKAFADYAVVVVQRFSSESFDNTADKGYYYLSDNENEMINKVTSAFEHVIVILNIAGPIDVKWIKQNVKISAALVCWYAGMEGGSAVADIISGDVNPSGKLTDTFANDYYDYPFADRFEEDPYSVSYYEDIYVGYRYFNTIPNMLKKVAYPFGFGLSYTTFDFSKPEVTENDGIITAVINVKNTGSVAGKEVIELYYSAPQGKLKKAAVELCGFAKTKLLQAGEEETVVITFKVDDMASFDDTGLLQKSALVLEKGGYSVFAGNSSVNLKKADFAYTVSEEFRVVKQCGSFCAPSKLAFRLTSDGKIENLPTCDYVKKEKPPKTTDYKPFVPPESEECYILTDIEDGKITMDDYLNQFTDDELTHLLGGHKNSGVADTSGYGDVERLGVPSIMCCDGPAGVRIKQYVGIPTTGFPCATLLACSFNCDLAYAIGKAGALESKENGMGIWLTPALNIHKNPLCGRNFEYYSEDPFISGKFAAAAVKGIQSENIAATVKHFAANSRELNRKKSDSRISERALREIYIKGFEICIKESDPWLLMTSYNIINGVLACENRELLEGILRGEWGYKGAVSSDWDTISYHPDMVLAGNDIKMPRGVPEELEAALKNGEITRADLLKCAKNVLNLILKIK